MARMTVNALHALVLEQNERIAALEHHVAELQGQLSTPAPVQEPDVALANVSEFDTFASASRALKARGKGKIVRAGNGFLVT